MTTPLRSLLLAIACLASGAFAADSPAPAWPLWDGHETIEQYAKRANVPPTKTLDLGNGVTMDFVLIPAGTFIMGTPEPVPVDEAAFRTKILVGQAALAVGVGILLVLIATVIIRAIREHHRPQYSLARFMAMTLAASVAVLGGMHWWHSAKALAEAQAEHAAALARYKNSYESEKPAHQVTLTTPYYIGKHEVTQQQYQQVTGANPSQFKGQNLPVETVSWNDATEFCKRLSPLPRGERGRGEGELSAPPSGAKAPPSPHGGEGIVVRLPTDAEWEYACRAGTTTTYNTGDKDADLDKAAWYFTNSKNTTHPVGQKTPNAWGVYDMHGNVWEWCEDWHAPYTAGAVVDPRGPTEGQYRVLRGGAWINGPGFCRSASRGWGYSDDRNYDIGFRVVVVVAPRTP
jgi:formylglycine-generating enzyme required for sulfatase activity